MFFQPEIETMPREELRELQLERMRESLRNAYENVPLYRERFDAAGVTPDDLTSLEDIAKFPFVVKQDMRDNYPFGMFARENADVARIHASSGTTGQATVVGHTANDLANWGDCFARGIAMVGGDENSTIQVSYGYGLFTGGLGAHYGAERLGATVIPMSGGSTKRQVQLMRDFGCSQSPQSAYLVNLGLESLHLRMARHAANGRAVAEHLASHPKVAWVRHPSLEGDSEAALAAKYLPEGSCGVVSFGVAGGRAAAETFMKNLKLAQIATHVADARTCVLHPANATHRQMNDAELEAAGISADLIRLSCGIEDAADLIADIDQALAAVE